MNMNEQDKRDPLSFKSQMAARYRERLAMGFIMGTSFLRTHQTQLREREFGLAEEIGISQDDVANAQLKKKSPSMIVAKSRSSTNEHFTNVTKPLMKDLIRKFEHRSFTSIHMKPSINQQSDETGVVREDWRSSSSGIKIEAVTQSPILIFPDQAQLNSPKLPWPPFSESHIATLNLDLHPHRTSTSGKLFQDFSSQVPHLSKRITEVKTNDICGNDGELNVTNSHDTKNFQWVDAPNDQDNGENNIELESSSKNSDDRIVSIPEDLLKSQISGQTSEELKEKSENPNRQLSKPLRVSLRGIAARKKLNVDKNYVVHIKDWTKRPEMRKLAPAGAKSITQTTESSDNTSKHTTVTDRMFRNTNTLKPKNNQEKTEEQSQISFGDHATSALSESTQKSFGKMSSSVQNSSTIESKTSGTKDTSSTEKKSSQGGIKDVKRRTSAVERYLQFLKLSKPPQPQHSLLNSKREPLKTSRPLNSLSFLKANKGIVTLPKKSLINAREPDKSIVGGDSSISHQQNTPQKQIPETVVQDTNLQEVPASNMLVVNVKELEDTPGPEKLVHNHPVSSSESKSFVHSEIKPSLSLSQDEETKLAHSMSRAPKTSIATLAPTRYQLATQARHLAKTFDTPLTRHTHLNDINKKKKGKSFHSLIPTRPPLHKIPGTFNSKPNILSSTSPRFTSSVSPRNLDYIKHSFWKRSVSLERKENCSAEPVNRPRNLKDKELANNELISQQSKGKMQYFPTRSSRFISSSEDSYKGFTDSPAKNKTSQFMKAIINSSADSAPEISAMIDTLQTQFIATKKIKSEAWLMNKDRKTNLSVNPPREYALYLLSSKIQKGRELNSAISPNKLSLSRFTTKLSSLSPSKKPRRLSFLSRISAAQRNRGPSKSAIRDCRYSSTETEKTISWKLAEDPLQETNPVLKLADGQAWRQILQNQEKMSPSPRWRRTVISSPLKKKRKVERSKKVKKKKKRRKEENGDSEMYNSDVVKSEKTGKEKQISSKEIPENPRNRVYLLQKRTVQEKPQHFVEKLNKTVKQNERNSKIIAARKPVKQIKMQQEEAVVKLTTLKRPVDVDVSEIVEKEDTETKESLRTFLLQQKSEDISQLPTKSENVSQLRKSEHGVAPEDCFTYSWDAATTISTKDDELDLKEDESQTMNCTSHTSSRFVKQSEASDTVCYSVDEHPSKSRIPALVREVTAMPRKRLDKLVRYRRWREAMLNCDHPSRLPLSNYFRQSLDSAVMEEWTLHSWQSSGRSLDDCSEIWKDITNKHQDDNMLTQKSHSKLHGRCMDNSHKIQFAAITDDNDVWIFTCRIYVYVSIRTLGKGLYVKNIIKCKLHSKESFHKSIRYRQYLFRYDNVVHVEYFCYRPSLKMDFLNYKITVSRDINLRSTCIFNIRLRIYSPHIVSSYKREIFIVEATNCSYFIVKSSEICMCDVVNTCIITFTEFTVRTGHDGKYVNNDISNVNVVRHCFSVIKFEKVKTIAAISTHILGKTQTLVTYSRDIMNKVPTHRMSLLTNTFLFLNTNNNSNSPPPSTFQIDEIFSKNNKDDNVKQKRLDTLHYREKRKQPHTVSKLGSEEAFNVTKLDSRKEYKDLKYNLTKKWRRRHRQHASLSSGVEKWMMYRNASDMTVTGSCFNENKKIVQGAVNVRESSLSAVETNQPYSPLVKDAEISVASPSDSLASIESLSKCGGDNFQMSDSGLEDNDSISFLYQTSRLTSDCLYTMDSTRYEKSIFKISQRPTQTSMNGIDSALGPTNFFIELDNSTQRKSTNNIRHSTKGRNNNSKGKSKNNMRYSSKGRNNNSKGNKSTGNDDRKLLCKPQKEKLQGQTGLPPHVARSKYCNHGHPEMVPECQSGITQNWASEWTETNTWQRVGDCEHERDTRLGKDESEKQQSVGNYDIKLELWTHNIKEPGKENLAHNEADEKDTVVQSSLTNDLKGRVHKMTNFDPLTKHKCSFHVQSQQRSPGTDQTYTLPGASCRAHQVSSSSLTGSAENQENQLQYTSQQKLPQEFGSSFHRAKRSYIEMIKYAPNVHKSGIESSDNKDTRCDKEIISDNDEAFRRDESNISFIESRKHKCGIYNLKTATKQPQNKVGITLIGNNERHDHKRKFKRGLKFEESEFGHRDSLIHAPLRHTDNVDVKSSCNFKFDESCVDGPHGRLVNTPIKQTDDVKRSCNYTFDTKGVCHHSKPVHSLSKQSDNVDVKSSSSYKCDDTDICRTSSTCIEDTTLSKSLRRDGRRQHKKSICRNILNDPKISTEMKRKVNLLVKSYIDFLEKEEVKRKEEGQILASQEVEFGHKVTKNVHESSTSDQISAIKREEEALPPLSTDTDEKNADRQDISSLCDQEMNTLHNDIVNLHQNNPTNQKLPTSLLNRSNVKKPMINNMSGLKVKVNALTSENKFNTAASRGLVKHLLDDIPRDVSLTIVNEKDKRKELHNSKQQVEDVPRKKSKLGNNQFGTDDDLTKPAHIKHVKRDNFNKKEDKTLFDKTITRNNPPAYDLILTYNMDIGAQSYVSQQHDTDQQTPVVDEKNQCFIFLINDKDQVKHDTPKRNQNTFIYNNRDTVLCLGSQSKLLLEVKQGDKKKCLHSNASRIPLYVDSEKVQREIHCSHKETFKHQKDKRVPPLDEKCNFNRKKAIEKRWDMKDRCVEEKKLKMISPTMIKKTTSVAKHQVDKISRSKIPVAVKSKQETYLNISKTINEINTERTCSNVSRKINEINTQPQSTLIVSPKRTFNKAALETPKLSLNQRIPPIVKKQLYGPNLHFQKTVMPKNDYEEQMKMKRVMNRNTKKSDVVSQTPRSGHHQKSLSVEQSAKNVMSHYTKGNDLSKKTCGKCAASVKSNDDDDYNYVDIGKIESRRFLGRSTYDTDKIAALRGKPQNIEHRFAATLGTQAGAVKTTIHKNVHLPGRKPAGIPFHRQPVANPVIKTYSSIIEKRDYTQNEAKTNCIEYIHSRNLNKQGLKLKRPTFSNVMRTACKQRGKMMGKEVYPDSKRNTAQRSTMERGHTLRSESITYKSLLSFSPQEPKIPLLKANTEYDNRKEAITTSYSPFESVCHIQLVSSHSSVRSHKSVVSAADSSTSSWRTASPGLDKWPENLPFPADVKRKFNCPLVNIQNSSSSSVNEHQSSKVYSISSYNIHDQSNSDKSSFSTMKDISDIPYTFHSNSQDTSFNYLITDTHFKGSSSETKSKLKNFGIQLNKKDELATGNYNTSNKKCWASLSEPRLTTTSCSKLVRLSQSVTNYNSAYVRTQSYPESNMYYNDQNGTPYVSIETMNKVVATWTEKRDRITAKSCSSNMDTQQQTRINCRSPPLYTTATQRKVFSTFLMNTDLNKSYNKSPIQKTAALTNRIRYSPQSSQPQSSQNLVYFCHKMSPECISVQEREVSYSKMNDSHQTRYKDRSTHNDAESVTNCTTHYKDISSHNGSNDAEGVATCKAETVSPRGLSTFANILKFWESMGPVKSLPKSCGKKSEESAKKQPTDSKKTEPENKSSEDNSTVFFSAIDEAKTIISEGRECTESLQLIGKQESDERNMEDLKEIGHSNPDLRELLDDNRYNMGKYVQDNSVKFTSKEACHVGLRDGTEMSHSRDNSPLTLDLFLTSDITSASGPGTPTSSQQSMALAKRGPGVEVRNLRRRTFDSCIWTPFQITRKSIVNMHTFGVTEYNLQETTSKQQTRTRINLCNIAYQQSALSRNKTPVQMFAPRKLHLTEHSSSTGLHSALESTPLKITTTETVRLSPQSLPQTKFTFSEETGKAQMLELPDPTGKDALSSSTHILTSGDRCFHISAGLDYTSGSSPERTPPALKKTNGLTHQRPVERMLQKRRESNGAPTQTSDVSTRKNRLKNPTRVPENKQIAHVNDQKIKVSLSRPKVSRYCRNCEKTLSSMTDSLSDQMRAWESETHFSKLTPSLSSETIHDYSDACQSTKPTSSSIFSKRQTSLTSEQTTTDQVHSSELDKLSTSLEQEISSSQFQTGLSDTQTDTHWIRVSTNKEGFHSCHRANIMRYPRGKTNMFQSSGRNKQASSTESETTMSFPQSLVIPPGPSKRIRTPENREMISGNLRKKLALFKTKTRSKTSPKGFATPQIHNVDVSGLMKPVNCGTVVLKKLIVLPKCLSVESHLPGRRNSVRLSNVAEWRPKKYRGLDKMYRRENTDKLRNKLSPKWRSNKNDTSSGDVKLCKICGECLDSASDCMNHKEKSETISYSSSQKVARVKVLRREHSKNKGEKVNSPCRCALEAKASPAKTFIICKQRDGKSVKSIEKSSCRRENFVKHSKKVHVKQSAWTTGRSSESQSVSSCKESELSSSMVAFNEQPKKGSFESKRLKTRVHSQESYQFLPQRDLLGISPSERQMYNVTSIINFNTERELPTRHEHIEERQLFTSQLSPRRNQMLHALVMSPLILHGSEGSAAMSSSAQEYCLLRRQTINSSEETVCIRSDQRMLRPLSTLSFKYPTPFHLVHQLSPCLDSCLISLSQTLLNQPSLMIKYAEPRSELTSVSSHDTFGIQSSQTKLLQKFRQSPNSTEVCHKKTPWHEFRNRRYPFVQESPAQKPVKYLRNRKSHLLLSDLDPTVSVISHDRREYKCSNILGRDKRDSTKIKKVLDSDFMKKQYRWDTCSSCCGTEMHSSRLPRKTNPQKVMFSAPSHLGPLKSLATTDVLVLNTDFCENAKIGDREESSTKNQNVPCPKHLNSTKYVECGHVCSELDGQGVQTANTQAVCESVTATEVNAPHSKCCSPAKRIKNNSMQTAQKQLCYNYLMPNLQRKLDKPSSAPCLSSTTSNVVDRRHYADNNLNVQLLENIRSAESFLECFTSLDKDKRIKNSTLNVNKVFWNRHRSGEEKQSSEQTPADSSNPTETKSCSQRFYDVEIVLGNDVPVKDFMNYLLKSLQTSSVISNDESCNFDSLSSHIRLEIDETLGNNKCSDQSKDLNPIGMKPNPAVFVDGNENDEIVNSEDVDKNVDKDLSQPVELNPQERWVDKSGFRMKYDLPENVTLDVCSRLKQKEETLNDCRNILNVALRKNSQKDLIYRGKNEQVSQSKSDTSDNSQNTDTSDETKQSQLNTSGNRHHDNDCKHKNNLEYFTELGELNENPNHKKSRPLHRRRQPLVKSSSSDSILLQKSRKRFRKLRTQGVKQQPKQTNENDTNNTIIKSSKKQITDKLPCPSSPALNLVLTSRKLSNKETHLENKKWSIRKLPEEEITFSKPQNYHLDKVIKSDNKVTVKFLEHKLKNYTKNKTENKRSNAGEFFPLKGLNATLLEKESQILLARDALAEQEHAPYTILRDKSRAQKIKREGFLDTCHSHQHYSLEKVDRMTGRCQHLDPYLAQQPKASITKRTVKKYTHKDLSPGVPVETILHQVRGFNPLVETETDPDLTTELTRSSNFRTAIDDSSSWSTGQDLASGLISKNSQKSQLEKVRINSMMTGNTEQTSLVSGRQAETDFPHNSQSGRDVSSLSLDKNKRLQMLKIMQLFNEFLSDNQHEHAEPREMYNKGVITDCKYDAKISSSHSKKIKSKLFYLSNDHNEGKLFLETKKSLKTPKGPGVKAVKSHLNVSDEHRLSPEPSVLPCCLLLSAKKKPGSKQCHAVKQDSYIQADLEATGNRNPAHVQTFRSQEIQSKPDAENSLVSEIINTILLQDQNQKDETSKDLPKMKNNDNLYTTKCTKSAHSQTVGTSTDSPKAIFNSQIHRDVFRSEVTGAHNSGTFRALRTSADVSKSTLLSPLEEEHSQAESKVYATRQTHVRTVGTSTEDATLMRCVNTADDSFSHATARTTAAFTTSENVRQVSTSTANLSPTKLKPLVERAYNCGERLKPNFGVDKHQEHQITQEREAFIYQNVWSKKPPQSPYNVKKRRLFMIPSHGAYKDLLHSDKSTTTEMLPFSEKIPQKMEPSDSGEIVLPPINLEAKQNDYLKRSSLQTSPRMLPSFNEIKVKAPCSLYMLQNNISLSVVQSSEGKCVKLVVPPDRNMLPYEIVVEPNSSNDGPAMVVADKGMLHVSFDRRNNDRLGLNNKAADTNKLTASNSTSEVNDESSAHSGSSSSPTSHVSSASNLCLHDTKDNERNVVTAKKSTEQNTSTKMDISNMSNTFSRKSGYGLSSSAVFDDRKLCHVHKSTQYEVFQSLLEDQKNTEATLDKYGKSVKARNRKRSLIEIPSSLHKSSQLELSKSKVNEYKKHHGVASNDKCKEASLASKNCTDNKIRDHRAIHGKPTQMPHSRSQDEQLNHLKVISSDETNSDSYGSSSDIETHSAVSETDGSYVTKTHSPDVDCQWNASSSESDLSEKSSYCISKPRLSNSNSSQRSAKLDKESSEDSPKSEECERPKPDSWSENVSVNEAAIPRKTVVTFKQPLVNEIIRSSDDSTEMKVTKINQREVDKKTAEQNSSPEEPIATIRHPGNDDSDSSVQEILTDTRSRTKKLQDETDEESSDSSPSLSIDVKRGIESQQRTNVQNSSNYFVRQNDKYLENAQHQTQFTQSNLHFTPERSELTNVPLTKDPSGVSVSNMAILIRSNTTNPGEFPEQSEHDVNSYYSPGHNLSNRNNFSTDVQGQGTVGFTQGAHHNQVRFSDRVTEYIDRKPNTNILLSCEPAKAGVFTSTSKEKGMITSIYSGQESRQMYDNGTTTSGFNRYSTYPSAAFDLQSERLQRQTDLVYLENNDSNLHYVQSGSQGASNKTSRLDTAHAWHSRTPFQGASRETTTSRRQNYPGQFAVPWSMKTDVSQRFTKRRTGGAERADSGYSELSTPTDYIEGDISEWDRFVKMKLQERGNVLI